MEEIAKQSENLGESSEEYVKTDEEERLEKEHFQNVVHAFLLYESNAKVKIEKCEQDFAKIPVKHQNLLPNYMKKLEKCKQCIKENQQLIKSIVLFTDHMFQNADYSPNEYTENQTKITKQSHQKVLTTLTQIVRDWTAEGEQEREISYGPILKMLTSMYAEDKRKDIHVLVPGAGLGRLLFEIANLGFPCQGNEFSLYMLFASNYILNNLDGNNSVTFYPWVHEFCNVINTNDQTRPVSFPDIDPRDLPYDANFSMAAGDFLEIYTAKNVWSCIVTCFFLDTAHNIIAYIEKISEILKPGGLWINHGPLLYHFADIAGEISVELSYEELRRIITKEFEFEILKEDLSLQSPYINNPKSMLKMSYNCAFFVARKTKD